MPAIIRDRNLEAQTRKRTDSLTLCASTQKISECAIGLARVLPTNAKVWSRGVTLPAILSRGILAVCALTLAALNTSCAYYSADPVARAIAAAERAERAAERAEAASQRAAAAAAEAQAAASRVEQGASDAKAAADRAEAIASKTMSSALTHYHPRRNPSPKEPTPKPKTEEESP